MICTPLICVHHTALLKIRPAPVWDTMGWESSTGCFVESAQLIKNATELRSCLQLCFSYTAISFIPLQQGHYSLPKLVKLFKSNKIAARAIIVF